MASNPEFLAGEKLTAAKLQQLNTQTTYVPVLTATTTSPTLGTSPTQDGYVVRSGNRVDLWVYIQFGTSPAAGSGVYQVSVPAGYAFSTSLLDVPLGSAWLNDNSTGNQRVGIVRANGASGTIRILTASDNGTVSNTTPWTWAASDTITFHASYPID